MGIEIKSATDLEKLAGSIVRKVEMLADPARVRLEIDGPDEMRYTVLITPNYTIQATPIGVTVNTGLLFNVAQDKE